MDCLKKIGRESGNDKLKAWFTLSRRPRY